MATTTLNPSDAKKRQQKIILAVLGVVLVILAVIQGPKLLGGDSPAPAATGTTDTAGSSNGTAAASTPGTAPVVPPGVPRAVLVGVTVGSAGRPAAGEGQLRSFTLFTQKDPFVQSLPLETSGATTSTGTPTLSDTQPGSGEGESGSSGGSGGSSTTAPPPGAMAFATIAVNGVDTALTVKGLFPKAQQLFVLVSLKPKAAKIAIAGGEFTDGATITLPIGRSVTLVNTATGARYALKLLYVGDQPEQVEGFTQGATRKK